MRGSDPLARGFVEPFSVRQVALSYAAMGSVRCTWRKISRQVVARDRACVRCGGTHYLNAHHVIPRAQGGPDTLENLVTLCASCHGRLEAQQRA